MLEAPEQGEQRVPRGRGRRYRTGGEQRDHGHQPVRAQRVVLDYEPTIVKRTDTRAPSWGLNNNHIYYAHYETKYKTREFGKPFFNPSKGPWAH